MVRLRLGQFTLKAPGVGAGELPRIGHDDRLYLSLGLSFALALTGVKVLRRRSRNHAQPDLKPS